MRQAIYLSLNVQKLPASNAARPGLGRNYARAELKELLYFAARMTKSGQKKLPSAKMGVSQPRSDRSNIPKQSFQSNHSRAIIPEQSFQSNHSKAIIPEQSFQSNHSRARQSIRRPVHFPRYPRRSTLRSGSQSPDAASLHNFRSP